MAKCPKCSHDIDVMATACPECGYSFPAEPAPPQRTSWAYSRLADVALLVGMVAALLWAGAAAYRTVVALIHRQWDALLIQGPLVFFLAFAMFVVFARASDAGRRA